MKNEKNGKSFSKLRSVLIITRNFPPDGGSGVQRVLKFVRYLPKNGWRPVVLTGESRPDVWPQDSKLLKEVPSEAVVIRCSNLTPQEILGPRYRIFQSAGKLFKLVNQNLTETTVIKIFTWVLKNLLGREPPWGWVSLAIKRGRSALLEYRCEVIYSTSYPIDTHKVASQIAKESNHPWVVDFRDPIVEDREWSARPPRYKKTLKRLEKSIIKQADFVIHTHELITNDIAARYSYLPRERFCTISNGYDLEDVDFIHESKQNHSKLILTHIGILHKNRDITGLFDVLSKMHSNINELSGKVFLRLYGKIEPNLEHYIECRLKHIVSYHGYILHSKVSEVIAETDILLLVIAPLPDGRLSVPGKTYEYLASAKPILLLGPKSGPAAQIIKEADCGLIVENQDVEGIRLALHQFWQEKKSCTLNKYNNNRRFSKKYERPVQASQLAALFNRLT